MCGCCRLSLRWRVAVASHGTGWDGVPARQRIVVERVPVQAVALPVAGDGVYVELFPLTELDRTFRFLSSVLVTGAAVSAMLGFVLGWWASRRALRPLTELAKAASRVARGDLHARLPDQDDPRVAHPRICQELPRPRRAPRARPQARSVPRSASGCRGSRVRRPPAGLSWRPGC